MMCVSQINLNNVHWNWLILLLLSTPWLTNCASLFPAMKNLADYSPINSSSTCGNPEIKVCRSSIQSSSLDVCTEDTCKFACCSTCSSSKPVPTDLGNIKPSTVIGIKDGPSRPGSAKASFTFESASDSHIDPLNLGPAIDYTKSGFTVSVWIKQKDKNKGTLISKTLTNSQYKVIFQVEIQNYKVWFYYQYERDGNTSVAELTPIQSQMQNLKPDEWHLITVTVISKYLSYFIDGELITASLLKGAVKDPGGRVRIGQSYGGSSQFEGFLQDVFLYNIALTNREVIELYTGILPKEYVATQCRCPPDYPKVMEAYRAKCTRNVDSSVGQSMLRLANTAHPIELATDGDTSTYWQSTLTDTAVIYLDLKYGELQVFYIILQFYGPQPSAIKIERSRDNGRTFAPWQYFAADCTKSFNMANNGALTQPDSVNCIQFELPLSSSGAEISFKTEQPPPPGSNVPVRPFGSPCTNLYCSPKLLEFLKASHVRFSFYNHTLVKNAKHRYFALNRIVVAGRCECFGHGKAATYIEGNVSHSGKCVCQCEPSTYSEGDKCDRCKPLYNNKPFKRGNNIDNSPCIKCECNQHASSCYYNRTLDPNPTSRTLGGGGVCIDCQHNTTGRYCDTCKQMFYRESGKNKSAVDVCTHCACTGPGVVPNKLDCVKDDTIQGKLAGQCECKQYTEGRQCSQCKPGYYDLKASHATGCVTCGCNTAGTINGNKTCHIISGQCQCKSNVMGIKCDTCKPGFYGLNTLEPSGCTACSCDPFGSLNKTVCNSINGQCQCKPGSKGLRCDQCDEGYHSLDANGCKTCNCSKAGSKPLLIKKCDAKNGQCFCKTNTEGIQCDRCRSGFFNLLESNPDGCSICACDPKGTVGMSNQCEVQSGNCTCKRYVLGKNCNQCQIGTYNLSLSNPEGCQLCNCFAKGTKDPVSGSVSGCSSNLGECNCLNNVVGRQCNSCAAMYYWNPSGKGCVACNCDSKGSQGSGCNMTSGQCQCKANIGGLRCNQCLPGNYGFSTGNCQPCGCNMAGSKSNACDDTGKCTCKQNVEGNKCDTCKTNTVNLQANNSYGCSGVPSQQPAPYITIISSRILNVKWNNPDNPNGVIDRFELYRNGTMVYQGLQRDFNDTSLTPNTYYYYYVITYTEKGSTRSYQDNRVYKTPEDSPQDINPPKITEVKARNAKASWVKPNVTNGVIIQYRLVSVNSRSPSEVEHCRGMIFSCDLTSLTPFTTYNFTLIACNSGGCGRSLPMKVITSEAAPDFQPMPNVTLVPGGKELIVYWDEPPVPNGKVFRYDLYMRASPFSGPGNAITPSSPVDVRNVTVTKLAPYTEYEFRVVSYTAQVNGATSSLWRRVRTAEGVPSGESAMQPKAIAVSSTSIKVTWSPPTSPRGVIVKYIVKVVKTAKSVETTGNESSVVVTGLSPYTSYKFTVVACNSYRCTGESGETDATRTVAAAPIGQNPPTITNVNAHSISLNWSHPQTPNGPVPPSFNVSRAPAAFNDPPQEVTAGAHFPGLGYYKFSDNVVIQGDRNDIEFSFRTQNPNGLVLFMASDDLQDMLAVELRDGKPWFVFDCQSGPASFTVGTANRYDDNQWHRVELTRNGVSGSITVDGKYTGVGAGVAGSNVIGGYNAVYVGGLPKGFKYDRTGKAALNKYHFIGCLKNFKSENKEFQWDKALETMSVTPLTNGCPVRGGSPGALLNGGGFLAISSNLFQGGSMFPFELTFRTQLKSGLLVFGFGPSAHVALILSNGKITLQLKGDLNSTSYEIPSGNLCDGNWQKVEILYIGAGVRFMIFVNGKNYQVGSMGNIFLQTNIYIGGIPQDNAQIVQRAKDAGIDPDQTFIGCVKDLKKIQKLDLSRDIVEIVNGDLDGCVSNNTVYTSLKRGTCLGMDSKTLVTQTGLQYTDSSVSPFVDYLYRVSSFHPNVPGSAKSSWVSVRSGPGAPEGIDAPTSVTPLQDGRSAQVTWTRPSKPNGLIVYYHIIATDPMSKRVVKQVDDVDVFNSTIVGLKPYTLYSVAIGVFTAGGNASGPSVNMTTKQAAPEGVPAPTAVRYPRMLALSWPEPSSPNGMITLYNLTLDSKLKYSGTDREFNVSGLEVYKPYRIQLIACTIVGCTKGAETTIYTGELPPQGLTQPTLYVLGNDSMRVEWNQPTQPNGVITHYEIHISTSEPLGPGYKVVYNGSRSDLSAKITGLITGTLYYVRVKAYSEGGGTFSDANSARTMSGIPSDIPAPILTAVSPYSIHVQILPPKKPNGVVTRYELYQDNINAPVLNTSVLSNYTALNLEVYSRHSFRVKACTFKGCNPSELAVGYSGELPPKGTITLQARITNARHVKVSWTRLAEHNGNVTYYLMIKGPFLVSGSAVMATEIRTERAVGEPAKEWTFKGLLPDSSYEFWVNASNSKGHVVSNKVTGKTPEAAPDGILPPKANVLSSTSVNVTWQPPYLPNGVLLGYSLHQKIKDIVTVLYSGSSLYYVVTGLEPYTGYQFRIAASTAADTGFGNWTHVVTHEDVPGPLDPPRANPESKSMVLEWNPPPKPNGVIIQYSIYMNGSFLLNVTGNVTKYTVKNLQPFTPYTFSLSACTVVGCSQSNYSRPARTLESVPSGLNKPVLNALAPRSVQISWGIPNVTNGIIISYSIHRRKAGQQTPIKIATVNASITRVYIDRTVQPFTFYEYRVVAYTTAGGGTPSDYSNITTGEGDPEGIAAPEVTALNSTSLSVKWKAPTIPNGYVINFIVRVLETNGNFSMNSSSVFQYTVTGLKPYIEYSIVIRACTIGDCGEGPPTKKRTLTDSPSGQPAPTAKVLSSTSLELKWNPPTDPNSPIERYELYRKTIEEPVNDNFTMPATFTRVYSNKGRSYVDSGLGIYSLQRYKVVVFTTTGSSTSPTADHRTGPAPPLAGPIVNATALNHTTVMLSWKPPSIKLLRGSVEKYFIYHEQIISSVNTVVLQYATVPGTQTSLAVTGLSPSTNYKFWVILYNKAGNFSSTPVPERTLDGVPEGFKAPQLWEKSSTEIRVNWQPPDTPNGKIVIYNIYANGAQLANASASERERVLTGLIPYTVYNIQVEVCTVYACTKSPTASKRTLPAAPERLAAPRLTPGPNFITVDWDVPSRPNGIMSGYIIYRRKIDACPTSPPPVTKCTYIECTISQELCGNACFDPTDKICCNGVLHKRDRNDPKKQCCGIAYVTKNNAGDICCGNKFHLKQNDYKCCFNNYMRVPSGSVCCQRGDGGALVGFGDSCCGDRPYFLNGSKVCVCDGLFDKSPPRQCCGGKVVASAQICCGDKQNGQAYDVDASKVCCGDSYVTDKTTLCCKGTLNNYKIYNYSSNAEKVAKSEKCCNTNKIPIGMSCCNSQPYNNTYQTCADKSSKGNVDCGTGVVCNKTSSSSAVCNRCDFPASSRVCGHVEGYYAPTSVPTTPKTCASKFQQVYKNLQSPSVLSFKDTNLSPHTEYDYYLVGVNPQGNTTSPVARNKTLMASPEGLDPPVATSISASAIRVTWKPPRVSNGILKEYKLTRINQQTKKRTLVYTGFELTYTDSSGLEPFTGYLYELQACTTECSAVVSTVVAYTDEAAPTVVSPPTLIPISSSSINVTWSLPPKPNGRIIRYNVSQIINSTDKIRLNPNDAGLSMFLIITNLTPYSNYTFQVTACTKIGCKEGPPASVLTLEAPPQVVKNPTLIATGARVVEASWYEPDVPNGVIIKYSLFRNGTLVYNGTNVCSKTAQGLTKCIYKDTGLRPITWYAYSVSATTNGGTTRSGSSKVLTPESSPEGVPLPKLTPRTANEIYAEWDAPQTPNGVITRYAIIVDDKEHDVGLNKNKVIGSLKPFTRYSFRVKACTSKGCGVGDRAYATTLEAPATGIKPPTLEAKEWNVVYITWQEPSSPNGIVNEYRVERRLGNQAPIIVCLTKGPTLLIRNCLDSQNNLKGYTVYEYRILAVNKGGVGNGNWGNVRTLEGPPRGIKQPVVHVINATAVRAKWEAPLEPNGVIISYELRYQPLNVVDANISVAGRVDSSTFNMTVNVLKPNTDYQFLITAMNKRREGSSSWTTAKTLEAPPSDIKLLNVERLSGGTSLRLYWDVPGSPNGLITRYNIYKDDIKIYEGKTREYVVTKLIPYTSYEFQLEACTSAGCTKGTKQTILSAEVNPSGQAAPTTGFVNDTVVVLNWRQPAVPNGVIVRYDVIRSSSSLQARRRRSVNDKIIYSTNNTNASLFTYTDRNLDPYTRYQYKIRAVNNGGQVDSDWLTVDTQQAPPSLVKPPTVTALDANRMNISWTLPQRPNGIIQYYLVHRNGTITHQGSKFFYIDVGLQPFTVYSYTITTCSGGGCAMSNPTAQRTNEAAPEQVKPPVLRALSAIAIRITWGSPLKPNGLITSYKLYESTNPTPLYSGSDVSFTVSARKPYTVYSFYIEACTSVGCTKGPIASVRTLESPPGRMTAPVATVAGPKHVRVQWTSPNEPNGVIKYYILTRDGKVVYNGSDLRYDDYDIAPFTVYSYTITAYNTAGKGLESPVGRNPTTNPGAPSNITAPKLTVLSSTSMRVAWSEPGRPNGVISKYVVLYNNLEKDAGLSKDVTLSGLQPYTLYSVVIKACTTSVACSTGEASQARTHEAPPELQGRPVFPSESIKARIVLITWSDPAKPNGFIIKYTLQRRKVHRPPVVRQITYGPVTNIYNATNGSALAFTDRSVEPYSEYEYRITSANSAGSTTSGWAVVKTLTDIPENVPKPEIVQSFSNSIQILIKAPSKPNGEIRQYVVKVSGRNTTTGLELSRVVGSLQPYTSYDISVYACTDAGCSESPKATARTTEAAPSSFSAPRIVKVLSRSVELAWDPPAKPNGVIKRYEVFHRLSCAVPSSCELPSNGTNAGSQTKATIEGLSPYLTYDFIVRAHNDKYHGDSDVKAARTLPEDPVTRPDSPPRVNVTGYHVSVDWSKCFILNGPLDGYTLLEKGIIVFLGEKTSANLPNRERGEYTYEVLVTTIVNGQKKTTRSIKVTVVVPNTGVIEPTVTAQARTAPVYETIWFIAVMALVGILLMFLILALCLRKRSGDRTVYVREREPLPPRSKMRSRPSSMSSLYSADRRSMMDMNTFNNGSTVGLFDNAGRLTPKAERYDSIDRYERYHRYNKHLDLSNGSVHKLGLDESSDWNDPPQTFSTKDSGLYLDEKPPFSDSDDDSLPHHYGYKKEQYFTDTHL